MTRQECRDAVLTGLGRTLKVTAGLAIDAAWAPAVLDELLDLHYPDPNHVFSDSDLAQLSEQIRLRWTSGRIG